MGQGAKNATFEPLRAKIDHFARTGSGQMQETVRKMAFFAGLPRRRRPRHPVPYAPDPAARGQLGRQVR